MWKRLGLVVCGCLAAILATCQIAAMGMADEFTAYIYEDGVLTIAEGTEALSEYWGTIPNPQVVVLPASLEEIDAYMFSQLGDIREYRIAPQNPYFQAIDGVLFTKNGGELVLFPTGRGGSYTLPQGTKALRLDAFEQNHSLREMILCEGMTDVEHVFYAGEGGYYTEPPLRRLRLSSTISVATAKTLRGNWLEEITVDAANPYYYAVDGVLFSRDGTLVRYPASKPGDHYDVPEGTLRIGEEAFASVKALKSVSLPGSVIELGDSAFTYCTYLEAISLPMTLERIGDSAFRNCVHLERASVPPLTRQGEDIFENCPLMGGEAQEERWFINYATMKRTPDGILSPENSRDMVVIRESPSLNGSVIASYPGGTTVAVLGQKAGFYEVIAKELDNEADVQTDTQGFVAMEEVQMGAIYQGLFKPVVGEVREGLAQTELYSELWVLPAQDFFSKSIRAGERVTIDGMKGTWYTVIINEEGGYIPANRLKVYAEEIPEGKAYGVVMNEDLRGRLHLRARPDKSAESLGRFFSGAQVEILGDEGDWYQVRVARQEGYMMKEFVQVVEVQP